MTTVKLKDTSLCAIVRECETNPAGGIVKFVEHSLPFLESGVIVDTRSTDITVELLESMRDRFPQLKIYQVKFQGFAHARNFAISKVETKRVLVLDADERLSENDYTLLQQLLRRERANYYSFPFLDINPNMYRIGTGIQTRLFTVTSKVRYYGDVYECLEVDGRTNGHKPKKARVYIKHFVPFMKAQRKKRQEFYNYGFDVFTMLTKSWNPPILTELPSFHEWNKYYPSSERVYDGVKNLIPPRFK